MSLKAVTGTVARSPGARWTRRTLAALTGIWLALALPLSAAAHAELISAQPAAGASLGTAPGVVVLEFSEALNPRLSSASVTEPSGRRWFGAVTTNTEIRIPLQTNTQGVYDVDWTSVSLDDGHHVSGSYTFGVRAAVSAGASAGTAVAPQASDLIIGVVKWVEALALLALVGQLLIRELARRAPPLAWVKPRLIMASLALAAGLVVVWAEATVASGGHAVTGCVTYFGAGLPGGARLARLGFEAVLLLTAIRGWRGLMAWTGAALVALAASGHAADVQPAAWGIGLDSVHLAAAGLWAGGITALATQRPPGGWRSTAALQLLSRFTPPALIAFAVTVTTGALQAVAQLGSLPALVQTSYGQVLLAKMALVGAMLPLSLMAWRLRRPHLRVEAGVAAGVIAAAAVLAAFPLPPTAAARQLARAAAPGTAGLPQPGQLTLASNAGSVLVGLTLEPGRPGRNRALVYLLPCRATRPQTRWLPTSASAPSLGHSRPAAPPAAKRTWSSTAARRWTWTSSTPTGGGRPSSYRDCQRRPEPPC